MRSCLRPIRAVSAALIATAALGLSSSATAVADDNVTSFGFSVSPRSVQPGGYVKLSSDGCLTRSLTVSSGAFRTVKLAEGHPQMIRIAAAAKAGARYNVTFDCAGERGTTDFTIAGNSPAPVTVSPSPSATAAIQGGFGGSAGGVDMPQVVTGAALLAAAACGGGLILVRRHRAQQHSDWLREVQ